MPPPTQTEFEQILLTLMNTNNDERTRAEQALDELKKEPAWLIPALLAVTKMSEHAFVKQMGAVVLRRCMSTQPGQDKPLITLLAKDQQKTVREQLLELLQSQDTNLVRRALSHCVSAMFTACDTEDSVQTWPELFPFILTHMRQGNPELKKAMLTIISQLAHRVEDSALQPHLTVIRDSFALTLNDQQPIQVQVAAIDAVTSLVTNMESLDDAAVFKTLLPLMLHSVGACLNANDMQAAAGAVEAFINVATSAPEFLGDGVKECFQAMMQIAQHDPLPDNVRQLAVEWCISFSEADPKNAKKVPNFIDQIIPLCLGFMLSPPEDADWAETDEDTQEICNYDVGVEALDRLAQALKGKKVEPVAAKCIAQALANSDWKHKHAGLIALAQIAEGCDRQLEPNLGHVVSMVGKHLDDPHPRVRWAAVHALAQFCNDFHPGIQNTLHAVVLPAFIKMLGDDVPRVHAHAAMAIVNFMTYADISVIEQYLDGLLTKLLMLLQKSQKRFVHVQVLSAISSIAEQSEEEFVKYYSHIMPYLKSVLKNTLGSRDDRMLRAKCMECLTLIMMSVGKEQFAPDAPEILDLLHKTQTSPMEPDDPQASYLLQAWGRVAKALGADFVQYLDHVMPPLLQQAKQTQDISVSDITEGEEDNDAEEEEEEGVQTIRLAIRGVGDKKITIRTSMLEDKQLACNVILSYLDDLKHHMLPYCDQISEIMIPLLKYPYMEEIRDSASRALPFLLKALKAQPGHSEQALAEMAKKFIGVLVDAMKVEPTPLIMASLCESFSKCVSTAPRDCLNRVEVEECAAVINKVFAESLTRRKKLTECQQTEDDEDEVERLEEENEGEEELLNQAVECVGSLVKTHAEFLQLFSQHFYPMCKTLLAEHATSAHGVVECRLALCVFDDFIEHGCVVNKGFVQPYIQEIINYFNQFIRHSDADLVQACAYGLGVLSMGMPDVFSEILPQAVESLKAIVRNPASKEMENLYATANAISSLMKILERHHGHSSGAASEESILPTILSGLPVEADEVEAKYVHAKVMDLVLSRNQYVVGQNNQNMPIIAAMFVKLWNSDMVDDETQTKMAQVLQQMGIDPTKPQQ